MASRKQAANHWIAVSNLTNYPSFVLGCLFPKETHMPLPEIASKYSITTGTAEQVFKELFAFLFNEQHSRRLLLQGPTHRDTDSSLTVVSWATAKVHNDSCRDDFKWLKIRDDARSRGSALPFPRGLRTRQTFMTPEEFPQANCQIAVTLSLLER
ncbi:hypothetical protein BGZ63DRAFT_409402 [Mariannaea sp. PMI_226]|nr:hypothetical protein BGZ63DRAFT_409402 [Mariannaea sp. PMI_226]